MFVCLIELQERGETMTCWSHSHPQSGVLERVTRNPEEKSSGYGRILRMNTTIEELN